MYPRNNFALKERNLSVRNLIWVFDPAPWQKTSSIFRFLNQDQDNSFPSQPGLSFKGVGLWEEGWKHLRPSDHQQLEEQHLSLHQGMEDRCDPFCPDAAPQCHDETGAGIRLDINCLFRGGMTVFVSKPLVRTNHACDRKLRSKDLAILSCVFKQIFFTAVQSGSIVWFRRPAFQATPQRGSLPHMGRAFTDIQEQKQVSCNISSSRFLRKQAFDHNILRGKVSIHPSRLKLLHALRLLEAHPL